MKHAAFEQRALRLFDALLDQPAPTREQWLHAASDGDPELIRAVEALVAADSLSGALPTTPPDAPPPAEPLPPPERLGHYRLGRELGRGGMGVVYLAERADGLFDQTIAVKLIRRHLSPGATAAFEEERRLLARIEHPNVARLIDGGVAPDGRPWLATEHVAGEAIDGGRTGRALVENIRLFLQAAQAVQFAHSRLIAHGDVKPANLLVSDDGLVKLLDFGVARLIGAEASSARVSFTPGFASPERSAGAPPSVADDVFALGRTLAAMTDGSTDRELAAVIARATAPEPARYPSAQALIADVQAWLNRWPVAAMNGGAAYRARKFVQRHRLGVLASVVALLLLAGAAFVAERNARRAEHARAAEALRFADAHRTAHYLMFTLLDRLERQPGTLRLRTQVSDVAQVYLDRLAESPDAPRDVRLDVANGYLRATATAGMSSAPNLGDVDRAGRDLAQASRMLAVLRRDDPHWAGLATPTARAASLTCQNQIYGSHDAARALREAKIGEAQVASIVSDPGSAAVYAWPLRICAGDALVWLNRTGEAIPLLERDLAAARARRSPDDTMTERNLRILGEAYFYAGRFADAERVLIEAAAIQAVAHARAPFYGPAVIEAANVADDLASTYSEQHRYADQLRVAQAALALVDKQAALDAADAESTRRALSVTRLVASALAQLGRLDEATALMVRSQERWAAMRRRFPNDATTARLQLLSMHVTADLQRRGGRRAAACATYAATLDGWTAFARRFRLSPSDAGESVAQARRNVAACGGRGTFADG